MTNKRLKTYFAKHYQQGTLTLTNRCCTTN